MTEVLASGEPGVPMTVRDLVLARLGRLPAAAPGPARLVAVVPAQAELWLLEEALRPTPWLRRVKDYAFAEEGEAGAAVHLSFDHLDLVDVAFHGGGAVGQGEPGGDGVLVAPDAAGEGVQLGLVVGFNAGEPVLEGEQALAAVIISAKVRMWPARASRCGQRAVMSASWAWSSASSRPGRVSSQRVIWRVFGTGGAAGAGWPVRPAVVRPSAARNWRT